MNKKKKYQYTAMTSAVLIIIAVIIINMVFSVLADKINLKLDLTKDNILTLSDTTKTLLSELDMDVNVISLIPVSDNSREMIQVDEVLKKYALLSDRINYQRIDSKKNPGVLTKYSSEGKALASDYNIIFETQRTYTVVDVNDLLTMGMRKNNLIAATLNAEQNFSSAIAKVTKGSDITVFVSQGHGECFNAENFKNNILPGSGYEFKDISLSSQQIPSDADILILASPDSDYSSDEILKIDEYLKQGGDIQIIADPDTGELTNLFAFMKEWGAGFEYGMAADSDQSNYAGYKTYIIASVPENNITVSMGATSQQLLFPFARPIVTNETVNTIVTPIAATGDNGYIKQDIYSVDDAFEDGDINGKSNLAVMLTRQYTPENASNMFVAGTHLFMGSYDSEESPFYTLLDESGNRRFCSALMSYMTDQPTNFYIIPKDVTQDKVVINQLGIYAYTMITVVFIPLAILALGLVIWIRRRHS